jgi:hypothetical protein
MPKSTKTRQDLANEAIENLHVKRDALEKSRDQEKILVAATALKQAQYDSALKHAFARFPAEASEAGFVAPEG